MAYPLHFRDRDSLLGIAVTAVLLTGCSIHPLPGNIPRVSTAQIVERIRCEAQEGLRSFPTDDPRIRQIIKGTSIGYEYDFMITEDNTSPSGQVTFERPDALGSFMLDVQPSLKLQRINHRAFIIIEDLTKLSNENCSPEVVRANWVYPITGDVGMAEVLKTYVKLQLLAGLTTPNPPSPGTPATTLPAVFADELMFTTDLSAGAMATLTLNSHVGSFRLVKASITGTAHRNDMHSVTVALAYDGPRSSGGMTMALAREARKEWTQTILDSREMRRVARDDAEASNRVVMELARRRRVREDFAKVDKLLGATP